MNASIRAADLLPVWFEHEIAYGTGGCSVMFHRIVSCTYFARSVPRSSTA